MGWGSLWIRSLGGGLALAVAASLGLGCQVDDRKLVLATSDGGVRAIGSLEARGEGATASQQPPAPLGVACLQNTDCSSGNCVDGVCCDSPCTDLCAACNLPGANLGTCSAATSDPLCPAANCRGQSSECRPLGDGQATLNCEAVGVCRASAECAVLPAEAGTPCQAGTGTCDGQGACFVPGKSALGQPCSLAEDCAEGHCVPSSADGSLVCCDAACDGVCQACSPAGRCEDTPAADARCAAVACPPDNICRDYVDAITDNSCRSFGQCRSALECGGSGFFTGLRPDTQCVCDPASGACALAAGVTCQQGADCVSGACVPTTQGDRVCCAGACGDGLFCSSAGTGCVRCEGDDVECDGSVQRTCSAGDVVTQTCRNGCSAGSGCNAQPPVGFLCDAGQCAPGGVCQPDSSGQSRCCVRNCAAEGKVCSPTGSCECPPGQVATGDACLLEPGDPCQNSGQCQAGLGCVDGVCCLEACGGYCERCQAGTGSCQAVPAGQQETDAVSGNSCTNGFECTGQRNSCRARNGQTCTVDTGCVSGNCEATVGDGANVCCSQNCTGARDSCRGTGQGCVECESAAQCGNGCNTAQGTCNPLRAAGETCTVPGQCVTNRCVPASDGNLSRCCPNCAAGQLCTPQGQCVNAQSGLGGPCSTSADCRQGVCSSGICCNSLCDTSCEVCGGSGNCQSNGACDVFDCAAPDPPPVTDSVAQADVFLSSMDAPAAARGGTIRDGRYVPTRIDIFGSQATGFIPTYEFQSRSVQLAEQDFLQFNPPLSFLPQMHYSGTFTTSGTSLTFDVVLCDAQFNVELRTQNVQYTATANSLVIISQQQLGTVMVTYARQ
jgi:hypothetical protein